MTARRAAWALCGLAIALAAFGTVLFVLNDFRQTSGWGTGAEFLLICVLTLRAVVDDTMAPAHVSLWLRTPVRNGSRTLAREAAPRWLSTTACPNT